MKCYTSHHPSSCCLDERDFNRQVIQSCKDHHVRVGQYGQLPRSVAYLNSRSICVLRKEPNALRIYSFRFFCPGM